MGSATRGFQYERELSDLRVLLDEMAVALHRADYARMAVRLGVTMGGPGAVECGNCARIHTKAA
jgi:hypothetical protein